MSKNIEGKAKIANTYRVSEPIVNFKIRVRIAQQKSRLVELFKTEEETRDSNFLEYEEKILSWQEKIFGRFEAQFYADSKNCATKQQKQYHETITEKNITGSRIYTYIDDDSYFPNKDLLTKPYKSHLSRKNASALPTLQNRKPFVERYNKKVIDDNPGDTTIRTNHYLHRDSETMYIIVDLMPNAKSSSYDFDDSQILLCTITFDKIHRSLTVDPDFTYQEPYEIHGTDMNYDYWIEHASEIQYPQDLETEVKELRGQVMQKLSYREAEIFPQIGLPPANRLRIFVNLDIMSVHNFPYDSLFVTYHIELPEYWSTDQPERLTGRTQRCSMTKGSANFSYVAEFCIELNSSRLEDEKSSIAWPWILISIASLDSWTRYRIEGYAAEALPATSGCHYLTLHTWRPVGDFLNTLRRFFTGGTYELQDLSYCGIPAMYDDTKLEKANLETVPSGQIELKLNIIQQSRSFIDGSCFKRDTFERLSAGRLMNSVNDVLEQFKAARERMIKARIMNS
ncbi:tectonic-like complex member MKS1 isoform X1 [Neodiprion pinetum]|uniref:tectonic-like complex member MKS1 isoform X1 n=1 Tax=Neodiprion pinetum TaxID=441929 RepID=UPI001EDEEEA6|nr:Meckel syndrome type 1 protein isoform X1 [Neodiprion pinetum]XP_046469672.1 Meckel syndrome type 1 protein isoform X1 [Neodiprion pinetum]